MQNTDITILVRLYSALVQIKAHTNAANKRLCDLTQAYETMDE